MSVACNTLADIGLAALKAAGFEPETAYMKVPRCQTCRHWSGVGRSNSFDDQYECHMVDVGRGNRLYTRADFGCVKYAGEDDDLGGSKPSDPDDGADDE